MKNIKSRRHFLVSSGKLIAGTAALGGGMSAYAMDEHHHHGAGDGMTTDASSKHRCATCQYWGGMRKLSKDKKQVVTQSMGWCNNPESPNYQKLTTADHEMKKAGIWMKWEIL